MKPRRIPGALLTASTVLSVFLVSRPALAETVVCPSTPAPRTVWVAPWGADYTSNGYTPGPGTFDQPWATLLRSFHRLCAGDTLFVRGGTYTENAGWGLHPGTSSYPIKVYSYKKERVVIMGTLTMNSANYWTFGGINVTRDPNQPRKQALVNIVNGVGWTFSNAEIWGTNGVSNMMISSSVSGEPRSYRVVGNCIHDNLATGDPFMNDHNIYLMPGYKSGPGIIERNIIWGAKNGANIKAAGSTSSTGAAYVTIRYNTMLKAGAGVIIGYGTHHVSMVRNLVGQQYGGGPSYNGAMFGNHVSGVGDVAGYSGVWGYPKSIGNTADSTTGIKNGGHIVWVRPVWDSISSCSGFHPQDAASAAYGRWAP
jgi:hypothetical protein